MADHLPDEDAAVLVAQLRGLTKRIEAIEREYAASPNPRQAQRHVRAVHLAIRRIQLQLITDDSTEESGPGPSTLTAPHRRAHRT